MFLCHNKIFFICSIKVPVGCTSELSYKGQQFLAQVFEKYDSDKDGMLNPTELKNVFSCCPRIPWHNLRYTVPTNDKVLNFTIYIFTYKFYDNHADAYLLKTYKYRTTDNLKHSRQDVKYYL